MRTRRVKSWGTPLAMLLAVFSIASTCRRDPTSWPATGPTPPQSAKEFDVEWTALDHNGSPANPSWVGQRGGKLPPLTNECRLEPFDDGCTSQKPTIDEAGLPNVLICMFEVAAKIKGHVNWTVASSVGDLLWLNLAADGDYNFMFFPDGDNGLTGNNGESDEAVPARRFIELEFDSRETIAHFATDWWTRFAQVVSEHRRGPAVQKFLHPNAPLYGARAVVYSLLGLDCEHNCQSEIHPVYALAIEIDRNVTHNQWAIFVRNSGNEGFCSRLDHHLDLPDGKLRLTLPHRGTKPSVVSADTQFATSVDGSAARQVPFPEVAFEAVAGTDGHVVLTFDLPPAARKADAEFVLTLNWPSSAATTPRMQYAPARPPGAAAAAPPRSPSEPEPPERYLERALLAKQIEPAAALAAADRSVQRATGDAARRTNVIVPTPATVPVVDFQPPPRRRAIPRTRLLPSAPKAERDRALISELCRAYDNKPPPFAGRDVSEICKGVR